MGPEENAALDGTMVGEFIRASTQRSWPSCPTTRYCTSYGSPVESDAARAARTFGWS